MSGEYLVSLSLSHSAESIADNLLQHLTIPIRHLSPTITQQRPRMLSLKSMRRQRTIACRKPVQISIGQNGLPLWLEHRINAFIVFGSG